MRGSVVQKPAGGMWCSTWAATGPVGGSRSGTPDRDRLFVNLSDEDGRGWTVIAVDRRTREYGVGQHRVQRDAAGLADVELSHRLTGQ